MSQTSSRVGWNGGLGCVNWISVKDRLPNENTPVIVYFADRGTCMICHYINDFSLARCGEFGFEPHGVTHWSEIKPPNAPVQPPARKEPEK